MRRSRWGLFTLAVLGLAWGISQADEATRLVFASAALVAVVLLVLFFGGRPRIRDWRDAEQATARWLRRAGCRRVALTLGSADGGIDVLTDEWAVQVKHTSKRVGRPAVQQLVGAALAVERAPALFSTSGFSAPAIEYALDHDVALFTLGIDGVATPVNRPARRVGKRRRRLLLRR